MEATRARFGSVIEWVIAAAFMVAAFGVGSIIMRELRTVTAAMPSTISQPAPPQPGAHAAVPARAVSVPVLLLAGGKEVRVGDTVSQVATRLGRQAEVGAQSVERAPLGDRLTRFYEHGGTRFVLVFEPFVRSGEPRVAAIYLQ